MPEHRIANCHRVPASRDVPVDVMFAPPKEDRTGRASFSMVQTCSSSWADPVCAGLISDYRRDELARALETHRGAGGKVHLLTYTARHDEGTNLSAFLSGQLRAVKFMREQAPFRTLRRRCGHVGSVRAAEITRGNNGWHPHHHELWFGDACDVGELAAEIERRWLAALAHEGLDGLPGIAAKVTEASLTADEYVSKYGRARKWDVDAELTKGISKRAYGDSLTPFDLLRFGLHAGDKKDVLQQCRTWYREYVLATKGKSILHWSPGLRQELGLPTVNDAKIARSVDRLSRILGRIGHEDWRRIIAADARLLILAAADTGEWAAVEAVLDSLADGRRGNKWQTSTGRAAVDKTPEQRADVFAAESRREQAGWDAMWQPADRELQVEREAKHLRSLVAINNTLTVEMSITSAAIGSGMHG